MVLQQLPAPEVVAPSSSKKPVDAAAAAAATMLQRQRRCTLQVPQKQLQRATELVYKITHSQGRAAPDRPAPAAAVVVGDTLVQDQAGKPRELLFSVQLHTMIVLSALSLPTKLWSVGVLQAWCVAGMANDSTCHVCFCY